MTADTYNNAKYMNLFCIELITKHISAVLMEYTGYKTHNLFSVFEDLLLKVSCPMINEMCHLHIRIENFEDKIQLMDTKKR